MRQMLSVLLSVLFFPFHPLLAAGRLTTAGFDRVNDAHYSDVSVQLCDPEAIPEARALMSWLGAQYGTHVLSGQYIDPYQDYAQPQFLDSNGRPDARLANELAVLQEVNGGKLPAVLGLDFTGAEFPAQWDDWMTQFAAQWHDLGGVVKFCWHWLVPRDITAAPADYSRWDSAIYLKDTNFSLKAALADPTSPGYAWLLKSMDRIAAQLKVLQEAGVPVLWRPLHEAAGGWFWWGEGQDAYLELYKLLYERLTRTHGLHNLIWLWNGQDAAWYPGDAYADILADDPYPPGNYKWLHFVDNARAVRFKYTRRTNPAKMVAMSENATLPALDRMWEQNTRWLFFCTWNREMVLKPDPQNQPYGLLREYSELYNSATAMRAMYNNPRVLTLDHMP